MAAYCLTLTRRDLVCCQVKKNSNKVHNTCWKHNSLQGLKTTNLGVSVTTLRSCCTAAYPGSFHTSTQLHSALLS